MNERGQADGHRVVCVAGKGTIAVAILDALLAQCPPDALRVLTNRTDDGTDGWQPSLAKRAGERSVRVIGLEQAYSEDGCIFLSLEYDRIVRPERFRGASLFNIHFSLLPRYRGMYPTVWPILHGDTRAGVTLHRIDAGIDTGPVLAQAEFALPEDANCEQLHLLCLAAGTQLVRHWLPRLLHDDVPGQPQDEAAASYFGKASIDYAALSVDFDQPALQVRRQLQAYSHRRYQLPVIAGRAIVRARTTGIPSTLAPGTARLHGEDVLVVATGDQDVELFVDRLEPWLQAAAEGDLAALRRWALHVSHVQDRNDRGWSALIVACFHGRAEAVRHLLAAGADPNDTNFRGTTALMYAKDAAIRDGDRTVFDLLLSHGADVDRRDFGGKRLYDYLQPAERVFLGIV